MSSRAYTILLLTTLLLAAQSRAAEYQFSVPCGEKGGSASLWIPPACKHLRGLLIGHQVILEDRVFQDPIIRDACAHQDLGIVILFHDPVGLLGDYHHDTPRNKAVDQIRQLAEQNDIDVEIKPPSTQPERRLKAYVPSDAALQSILQQLADQSGYAEVATAPFITLGHSGGAIFAWNMAYCFPDRIVGVIGLHSAVLMPPAFDTKATPTGFPACCISGEYESWTGPTVPLDNHWRWLRGGILDMRGHFNTQAHEIVQPGSTHFNWDEPLARHVAMFIEKAAALRIPPASSDDAPATQPTLRTLPLESGWLTDVEVLSGPSRYRPAPYNQFGNDPALAFWHMDKDLAESTENFPSHYGGKTEQRVTFVQDGKPIPASWIEPVQFQPLDDGITIKVAASFLDRTPANTANSGIPLTHADEPIKFRLIGGWGGGGEQVGPDTFRIRFDHFGDSRWCSNIQIMAYAEGTNQYKYAEQPCQIQFPDKNKEGAAQTIDFKKIDDVKAGVASIPLTATATSGLPVCYFVRQGPAVVEGNTLKIDAIPPRTKFPVKVDIVAYQWGRSIEPKVQSAADVEQVFYIQQ
jgi:pimeloyl-ACP methyl ester carboxylesterase